MDPCKLFDQLLMFIILHTVIIIKGISDIEYF